MIVSVTGPTGFVGLKLIQRLLDRGDDVRVLTRKASLHPSWLGRPTLFIGDLTSPSPVLARFVDGADVLIHCAGELRNESRMALVNVEGTRHLIDFAHGKVKHWVQLSSVGVYGYHVSGDILEETIPAPETTYETSKAVAEQLVRDAMHAGAFEATILRPSNIIGNGMPNAYLLQMAAMIRKGFFFKIGSPDASANFIHVEDVAAALVLCATKEQAAGRVYNLSNTASLDSVVATIASFAGVTAPRTRVPERLARLAVRGLGWLPRFPLTQTRINVLTCRAHYPIDRIQAELGYCHHWPVEDAVIDAIRSCEST